MARASSCGGIQGPAAGPARRRLTAAAGSIGAALAVEFADELVDGAKSAGLPLIRHSIGLSYGQLGLLLAIPLIAGSLIELPLGLVAGRGHRRHWFVLGGGIVFAASVAGIATARSFGVLLAAFVVFFPASGAFVSLTQAALMDAAPAPRRGAWLAGRWRAR